MESEFKKLLKRFLIKERITLQSGILNDITYRLMGKTQPKHEPGFSFVKNSAGLGNEEVRFFIPLGSTLEELYQIMEFFQFPKEQYKIGHELTLDEEFLKQQFLHKFIDHFNYIKKHQPQIIIQYKKDSAITLESATIKIIKEHTKKAKNILLTNKEEKLTPNSENLMECILLIFGQIRLTKEYPLYYTQILNSRKKIQGFLLLEEFKKNTSLYPELKEIEHGMNLYAEYSRNPSIVAITTFKKEFKILCQEKYPFYEKNVLFGEILLNLAGIRQYFKNTTCYYESSEKDPSRLILRFEGTVTSKHIREVINYLSHFGGETTCSEEESCAHEIGVDGKFFFEKIFPKIKARLEEIIEDSYQKEKGFNTESLKHLGLFKIDENNLIRPPVKIENNPIIQLDTASISDSWLPS
jgi:hypothetical protein